MGNNLLLTFTSSMQFGIFAGVALIIFGWIEKKERFSDIGRVLLIALGVYALWILLTGQVHVPEMIGDVIPKELRAISFFKGIVICASIFLLSFLLKLLKIRYYQVLTVIGILGALFLFFMVYNLQKA